MTDHTPLIVATMALFPAFAITVPPMTTLVAEAETRLHVRAVAVGEFNRTLAVAGPGLLVLATAGVIRGNAVRRDLAAHESHGHLSSFTRSLCMTMGC
jgi:hypothetical protein